VSSHPARPRDLLERWVGYPATALRAPEQDEMVASNALSIAQAHFEPNHWMRAIFAGDEPAGFLLTKEDRQRPLYYLWRFMKLG